MPADKDLPPTAFQRSLVRHKTVWRFGVVAVAVIALAGSIWTSLDGEGYGAGWVITAGLVFNLISIFLNIAASERHIRAYDARSPT